MIRISNHYTAHKGNGLCVPEFNVFWCEMGKSTQQQKPKKTL